MSMRILTWSAIPFLGALLLSGCAAPSARTAHGQPQATKKVDYSRSAVEARTESQARYAAAILHELNDEPEAAAEDYYQAAVADPANESLAIEASSRLLRQKMTERAIEILKNSADRPGSSGNVHARLGLAYSVAGKKELALAANQTAIRKEPDLFQGYQYLAQLHLQGGQVQEGLKVLDEAGRRTGAKAEFLIDLGEAYITFARGGTNDIKPKALETFRRAAALHPTSPAQIQRLADGFHQLGDSDRAIEFYLLLLEKVPHLTFVRDRLVDLYMRKQDRSKAADQLRVLVDEAPTNPQAQYLLGTILFEERKHAEAEECFSKTILLTPNFEPVYYDLAAVQISADKALAALETLKKARSKFPQNFVGEFYTALAYSRLKEYSNSLNHFTAAEVIARATATNRLTHTFYFQLGSAYERNQKFQDAEKYFRKALQLSPDFAEALNYLGYMWADRGENLEEAKSMIEKAVKLEPENAAFLDSLGWVLFKLDQPAEALKWILKALERVEEPDATLYDHLGDIYARLKQHDQAREAWKKSTRIEPNPQIEEKLKRGDTAGTSTPEPGTAR